MFLTQSTIATETAVADGGDIQIRAQDTVRLQDSNITTAVRGGDGQGGNILIDPEFVILERSQILADATSRVSASSAQNVGGTITIDAFTNPNDCFAPIASEFLAATALLHHCCMARLHTGVVSSLLVSGRGGVPPVPEGSLPSC